MCNYISWYAVGTQEVAGHGAVSRKQLLSMTVHELFWLKRQDETSQEL